MIYKPWDEYTLEEQLVIEESDRIGIIAAEKFWKSVHEEEDADFFWRPQKPYLIYLMEERNKSWIPQNQTVD